MHRIDLTLVYFLIFTIASSAFAYYIIVRAYDSFDDPSELIYSAYVK